MNINEPWEAQIDWAPDFPRGSHVFDGHGNEIATNVDGFQANLIAAAPDLLAALQRLMDLIELGGPKRIAPHKSPIEAVRATLGKAEYEAARAAIAKAKGE